MEFEREISEQRADFEKILNREQQKAATQETEECKTSSAAKLPKLSITKSKHQAQERSPKNRDVAKSINKRSRGGYYHHFGCKQKVSNACGSH